MATAEPMNLNITWLLSSFDARNTRQILPFSPQGSAQR